MIPLHYMDMAFFDLLGGILDKTRREEVDSGPVCFRLAGMLGGKSTGVLRGRTRFGGEFVPEECMRMQERNGKRVFSSPIPKFCGTSPNIKDT